jgi:hypothetical protein
LKRVIPWLARIAGAFLALFMGAFALDAVDEGTSALLLHLLPAVLIVGLIAVSWWREWITGAAFLFLAGVYALYARQHFVWVLVISVPLAVVGGLFLTSWRLRHDRARP